MSSPEQAAAVREEMEREEEVAFARHQAKMREEAVVRALMMAREEAVATLFRGGAEDPQTLRSLRGEVAMLRRALATTVLQSEREPLLSPPHTPGLHGADFSSPLAAPASH